MISQIEYVDISRTIPLFINTFSQQPYDEKWTYDLAFTRFVALQKMAPKYCLKAEIDGEVVGIVYCSITNWYDGVHVFVEDLAVVDSQRGKGIGSKLVSEIEKIAKSEGISTIDLAIHRRSGAMNFWGRLGYSQTDYALFEKKL